MQVNFNKCRSDSLPQLKQWMGWVNSRVSYSQTLMKVSLWDCTVLFIWNKIKSKSIVIHKSFIFCIHKNYLLSVEKSHKHGWRMPQEEIKLKFIVHFPHVWLIKQLSGTIHTSWNVYYKSLDPYMPQNTVSNLKFNHIAILKTEKKFKSVGPHKNAWSVFSFGNLFSVSIITIDCSRTSF